MQHLQANFGKTILFLTVGLSIGIASLFGQTQPAKEAAAPAPKIQFDEIKFDFGRLLAGGALKHEFTYTNAGNAELVISNIVPACGCTSIVEWTKNIPPGGKGKIPLEFNSTGMSGAINRSVAVHSNDPTQPVAVLLVAGVVWQHVEVSPSMALIQMPPNGSQNFSTTLKIVNQMEEPLKLESPVSSVPQFHPRIEQVTAGKEFHLIIDTVAPLPRGDIQGFITIATSAKKMPVLNIGVLAIAQPEILVSPAQMFLPVVASDVPEPYIITVRNQSPDPITLTNAACDAEGSTVVLRETNPGREFELAVTFSAKMKYVLGKTFAITAETSLPSQPKIRIPVAFANAPPVPQISP